MKLYTQFNNPDDIKIDDTSLPQAVCDDKHEEEYNNADKIVTFLSCGLVIPITFTLVLILLLRSIREPMRVAITKPKNHAYLVALALTGMVFTGFVLVMDICALVFTVEGRHEFTMHTSIRKEYSLLFVVITTALDALPILHSCIVVVYLRILACTCCETNHNVLRNYFEACLYPIFGKIKIKGTTEDHGEEFKVWIVTTLCFAPLFCIASHSGYIVVSWVADTEHATSITIIYILSFLYYFISFRHLYIVFGDTKQVCPEAYLIAILFLKLYNWLCFACNCFWCCCCRCWGNGSNVDLPNDFCKLCSFLFCTCCTCYTCCLKRYKHERDTCRGKCYNCCEVYKNQLEEDVEDQELGSPISAQKDRKNKHSKAPFNLPAFFIGIWIGIFLSSVEAVIILGFVLIPITLDKAPIDIYHIIQLVFIVLTTLITYKFFNVGEGPKKIMQAFVQKFSDLRKSSDEKLRTSSDELSKLRTSSDELSKLRTSSDELSKLRTSSDELSKLEENEAAGRVIGEVAHTIINLRPQQPPPSGQASKLGVASARYTTVGTYTEPENTTTTHSTQISINMPP